MGNWCLLCDICCKEKYFKWTDLGNISSLSEMFFSIWCFQIYSGDRSKQFFNAKYFKVTDYCRQLNKCISNVCSPASFENLPLMYQSHFEDIGMRSLIFQSSCRTKENFVHVWCLRTTWAETEKLTFNAVYLQKNYKMKLKCLIFWKFLDSGRKNSVLECVNNKEGATLLL